MADQDIDTVADAAVIEGPEREPLARRLSRLGSSGHVKAPLMPQPANGTAPGGGCVANSGA